MVNNTNIG